LVRSGRLAVTKTISRLTTTGISVNLLALLVMTHIFFPRARSQTSKFFHMSYYNPETDMYGCGTDDLSFVLLWTVIFTGVRVSVMEYMLDPLARLGGIRSKKGLDRFKEQAWLIIYYTASWSLGMVRCTHGTHNGKANKAIVHHVPL
jgi:acyl-CoA-dependent ceramide synthase